ncbi:FK506-binding protein 1-like isoform X3 [Henckelia pumila]|uniref:FK506-binding protein 1-like isoform X3 n=1 Tax=Henckelia pumila TaxID=405737 RepID=UPI003C6E9078
MAKLKNVSQWMMKSASHLLMFTGLSFIRSTMPGENIAYGIIIRVFVVRLKDGDDFDSSLDRGVPFTFKLGQCEVIEGWDEGITTMRKGENGTIVSQCDKGLEFSLTDGGFPVLKRISHSSPSRKVISTIPRCSGSSESSGDKSESSDQNKITRSSWV